MIAFLLSQNKWSYNKQQFVVKAFIFNFDLLLARYLNERFLFSNISFAKVIEFWIKYTSSLLRVSCISLLLGFSFFVCRFIKKILVFVEYPVSTIGISFWESVSREASNENEQSSVYCCWKILKRRRRKFKVP